MTDRLLRVVRIFGRFWWDFLVGDTPELFLATLGIVALAFALRHQRAAAVVTLPLVAATVLAASAYRGRRNVNARVPSRRSEPSDEGEPSA